MPRTFTIATFYDADDRKPARSRVRTYSLWYSAEWPGCIVYKIDAGSSVEARRQAIDLRLAHETALHDARTIKPEPSP